MDEGMMKAGVRPVGPRLLVKPIVTERRTAAGILIPEPVADMEDRLQIRVEVIAVGEMCWEGAAPWCGVGDEVVITRSAGVLWKGEDQGDYRIISHRDVLAVILKKEAENE